MKKFPILSTFTLLIALTFLQLFPSKVAATSTIELAELIGDTPGGLVGYALATGDINGDGYDDILTSAVTYNTNAGAIYLVYGGEDLFVDSSLSSAVVFTGSSGDYMGNDVAAGDVNGDGYDDIIFGQNSYSASTGAVYIIYGQADQLSSATINDDNTTQLIGQYSDIAFGTKVGAADLNDDGADEILVGATSYGASNEGAAIIVYGIVGSELPDQTISSNDVTFTGVNVEDALGEPVSSAGDINDDGIEDAVFGMAYGGSTNTGHIYLLYGSTTPYTSGVINTAAVRFTGVNSEDYAYFAKGAGDINGDGYDDFMASSTAAPSGDAFGAVYMIPGKSTNYTNTTLGTMANFSGTESGEGLGRAMAGGDINGDGYDDVIMSTLNQPGQVYIGYGNSSLISESVAGFQDVTGEETTDQFGDDLATGDLNNDGYDEVIITAQNRLSLTGSIYILYSTVDNDGDGIPGTDGVLFDGADTNDHDFDNDGVEDEEDTVLDTDYEIIGDDVDNDGDGEVDENNTLEENGIHTNYEDLDPNDAETAAETITRIRGKKNGKIKVTYSDESSYIYTVFSASSDRKTKVKQFDDLGYLVVVQSNSKKIALLNAYTGEIYNRKTINENARRYVSLKLLDVRNDDLTEAVVTNRKGDQTQVMIFKVNTTRQTLKKRSGLRLTDANVDVSKTKKKRNKVLLRNSRSRVLHQLTTNSSYKLTLSS